MIEAHQGLISPFLTRDHEAGADYGSRCSIYPVRFAGSRTAVAQLTRDHGPSATGTFTRSGPSQNPRDNGRRGRGGNDHARFAANAARVGKPSGSQGFSAPAASGWAGRGRVPGRPRPVMVRHDGRSVPLEHLVCGLPLEDVARGLPLEGLACGRNWPARLARGPCSTFHEIRARRDAAPGSGTGGQNVPSAEHSGARAVPGPLPFDSRGPDAAEP